MGVENKTDRNKNEKTDYDELIKKILNSIDNLSQSGFEKLVTDLLVKMGYEVYTNAKKTLSSISIHGIIIEDRPGFFPLYVHIRKLERGSIITSWSMHNFSDAITRKGGRGLLITNAHYSKPAQDYAKEHGIILIDGIILARLMIVNNFCMNVREVVEIKSIDTDALNGYA